jgi:peroxiredoxin
MSCRQWLSTIAIIAALGSTRADEPDVTEIPDLLQEYQAREKAYRDAARESGAKTDLGQHPAREYLPRFKELAEKHAGQAEALPALTWILEQASRQTFTNPKNEVLWVVERLSRDHAAQPEIGATLEKVARTAWNLEPEPIHALYDAVLAKNKDRTVLAQAAFQKAVYTAECSEKADEPKPLRQQAIERLRDVKKTYTDSEYAKRVDGWLFELQHLQVGMKAPDIIGVDVNGKAVKLADYRGQVVVIVFWGDWHNPDYEGVRCERDLMSMYSDKSFAVVGINVTLKRQDLQKFLSQEQLNFPNICDGPDGPIAREWNVRGWPMRYVLDHHGVIRYRHLSGQRLGEVVKELLKKAPPKKEKAGKKP